MATQVRPVTGGGWNAVSKDSKGSAKKDTTYGITLPVQHQGIAMSAINEWANCGGVGTAAVRATQRLAAIGLSIQEV